VAVEDSFVATAVPAPVEPLVEQLPTAPVGVFERLLAVQVPPDAVLVFGAVADPHPGQLGQLGGEFRRLGDRFGGLAVGVEREPLPTTGDRSL
jgi:hypothetical protein